MIVRTLENNKIKLEIKHQNKVLMTYFYTTEDKFSLMLMHDENHVVTRGILGHRLYEIAHQNYQTFKAFLALVGEKMESPEYVHNVVDPEATFMKNTGDMLDDEVLATMTDHYFIKTPQNVKEYHLLRGDLFVGYASTRDEDKGELRYITRKCGLEEFIIQYHERWAKA
jgi:hypothetical protein